MTEIIRDFACPTCAHLDCRCAEIEHARTATRCDLCEKPVGQEREIGAYGHVYCPPCWKKETSPT
jgi:hypothetical protein